MQVWTDQISSILDYFCPILASVLRKPRKRVTVQVQYPLQYEEVHGGQETSQGQHVVIDSLSGSREHLEIFETPSAIFLPRLGRRSTSCPGRDFI